MYQSNLIKCFGNNKHGENDVPEFVSKHKTLILETGLDHNCAVVQLELTIDVEIDAQNELQLADYTFTKHELECWGLNSYGQTSPVNSVIDTVSILKLSLG